MLVPIDKRLTAAQKREKAVELRIQGWTYDQIARELGFATKASAHNSIRAALKLANQSLSAKAAEYRDLELAKLDAIEREMWKVILSDHILAQAGEVVTGPNGHPLLDPGPKILAAKRLVEVSARRARLLGLDSTGPAIELSVQTTINGVDLDSLK